jgi:uncharacterized protein (DUF362 family)
MKKFLKIKTIYSKPGERNLEFLSDFYGENEKLIQVISELLFEELLKNKLLFNKVILLKPNWVMHSTKPTDQICLHTHNNFILAALEVIASQKPSKIIIADAPIQGCKWEKIITPVFFHKMNLVCENYNVPLVVKDMRKVTFDPYHNIKQKLNKDEDYTIFNLGTASLLEPLSLTDRNPFRVTYYNPDRLKESHFPGTHKYCISNRFLEADVIISLPKIKTHQKTGITCALKNLVGINGDKDYLPHHRIGGSEMGGDCYPGKSQIRYFSEIARDIANRNIGNKKYKLWAGISYFLWNALPKRKTHSLSAGWYGNDTTWRMVLDINKISVYGNADGTLSSKPQRIVYSLCDGVVGGQGDGPLNPIPYPLGIISFTNDSGINDIGISILMGFDWQKIFLLNNLISLEELKEFKVVINKEVKEFFSLKKLSIPAIPPPGWEDFLATNIKRST